jgi:hypothetical protein
MAFITTYKGAMRLLNSIGTGKCAGTCKKSWIRNFKYALKTKTNPLKLTAKERKNLTKRIKEVSGKNVVNEHNKTLKKYKTRNSPPYPANENCGKKMKGNDGNMYISNANKNGVCSWKKV